MNIVSHWSSYEFLVIRPTSPPLSLSRTFQTKPTSSSRLRRSSVSRNDISSSPFDSSPSSSSMIETSPSFFNAPDVSLRYWIRYRKEIHLGSVCQRETSIQEELTCVCTQVFFNSQRNTKWEKRTKERSCALAVVFANVHHLANSIEEESISNKSTLSKE